MLIFDHLKLVRRKTSEVKRLRKHLVERQIGDTTEMTIAHENDGSCCRREPWNTTLAAIFEAVNPPTKMIAVNLNPPTTDEK